MYRIFTWYELNFSSHDDATWNDNSPVPGESLGNPPTSCNLQLAPFGAWTLRPSWRRETPPAPVEMAHFHVPRMERQSLKSWHFTNRTQLCLIVSTNQQKNREVKEAKVVAPSGPNPDINNISHFCILAKIQLYESYQGYHIYQK